MPNGIFIIFWIVESIFDRSSIGPFLSGSLLRHEIVHFQRFLKWKWFLIEIVLEMYLVMAMIWLSKTVGFSISNGPFINFLLTLKSSTEKNLLTTKPSDFVIQIIFMVSIHSSIFMEIKIFQLDRNANSNSKPFYHSW